MSQQDTPELVLAIHMNTVAGYDGKPYGRFEAYVYAAKPEAQYDDTPWSHCCGYESVYADFALSAYYGTAGREDGGAYGFTYGYSPSERLVGSWLAERYARGMKQMERAHAKRVTANGEPESLGQHVVYVMQALGIRRAFVRVPAEVIARSGGGSYYRDWRPLDRMSDIQSYLNTQVSEFREAHLALSSAA